MNTTTAVPTGRFGPAFTLVLLAPLIAEVLPGATRMSSIFVLPIEMAIWGGGALLIRAAVRHWKLGWLNMLLLAFGLSIAEEFLVQQTSIAPMVFSIVPGPPFARAFGVNYVYFLWALFYEAVLVVMVPVIVTELIFHSRRADPWIGKTGAILMGVLFLVACLPAWYSWTQIVRITVLHLAPYSPPLGWIVAAAVTIALLIYLALGAPRQAIARASAPLKPAAPWLLGVGAFLVACIWYGLVVLAFGMRPTFPPAIPVAVGLSVAAIALYLLPRFAAHPAWSDTHRMWLAFGAITGSMAIGFVGFIYATAKIDLYGKITLNVIALMLLVWLAVKVRARA